MTKQADIVNLFQKYIANECEEHETRMLLKYFEDEQNAPFLKELISEYLPGDFDMDDKFHREMNKSFEQTDKFFDEVVLTQEGDKKKHLIFRLSKYIAAACIIFLVGFGVYSYLTQTSRKEEKNLNISLLVFPSGHVDSLESQFKGERIIIQKNGLALIQEKVDVFKVVRLKNEKGNLATEIYSLRSARGRKLWLRLIDGSTVALNSLSELKFALDFSPDKRWLELTGEGYFDIVSNPKVPLFVKTPDQLIQVYGTKFNVRNYSDDDEVKTTLFHGKVSVKKVDDISVSEYILDPGEQAVLKKKDHKVTQKKIDNELEILAWTDDKFIYEGTPLKEIMKDLSRWYDVEVDWASVPDYSYQGTIPHDYSLEKAIKLLEKTGNIKINLNNNRISF